VQSAEPSLKAKFKITLGRLREMVTISNMPKEKTIASSDKLEAVDGYVWDVYEESVPMSTYLVAFVVSDFVSKTSGNFSVWGRSDAIQSCDYALDIGPRVLKFLEEFFDIKYPLPKTDNVALPDFQFGAMGEFVYWRWWRAGKALNFRVKLCRKLGTHHISRDGNDVRRRCLGDWKETASRSSRFA